MSRKARRRDGADDVTDRARRSAVAPHGAAPEHGESTEVPHDADPAATDRPATFREVFAVREYRAIFSASAVSWIGDYVAKVAITYLIFTDTGQISLSAAAFAISYLPWIAGGPVLAAIAERYPYRQVMITCDLARVVLVALLAIPAVPLPALLALLFLASLMSPPEKAARSAMLPLVLKGDRYVVGLSVQATVAQAAQVGGYAAGGALAAALNPRAALLVDSATFAISALLVWRGVRHRPSVMTAEHRSHLLRETAEGFRVVFSHRVMRAIALLVFASVPVVIVPEGLAPAWSGEFGGGAWRAGLMMASIPLGYVVGALLIGRMMAPSTRLKLIRPLALLVPVALIPALLDPPFGVVIVIGAVAGFGSAVMMPLNGLFVQVLPNAYRARAFGVMQGGMQVLHAVAVLAAGVLADWFTVPVAVGAWACGGLVLIAFATARWPSTALIDSEIERVRALNDSRDEAGDEAGGTGAATRPADTRPATGSRSAGASDSEEPARL